MTVTKPLKAWVERMSAQDWAEGAAAYPRYRQTLSTFAKASGVSLERITAGFTALSPNNDYKSNLRSLKNCLLWMAHGCPEPRPTVTTYNSVRDRALSYLLGEEHFWDHAKGLKTRNFYLNLLYPDLHGPVTVDGHMICIYTGRDDWTMTDANKWLSRARFREVEAAINDEARQFNIPGSALQAALWFCRKRVLEIKAPETGQDNLFDANNAWQNYVPWEHVRGFDDMETLNKLQTHRRWDAALQIWRFD